MDVGQLYILTFVPWYGGPGGCDGATPNSAVTNLHHPLSPATDTGAVEPRRNGSSRMDLPDI